jgi:hypothetical protein
MGGCQNSKFYREQDGKGFKSYPGNLTDSDAGN